MIMRKVAELTFALVILSMVAGMEAHAAKIGVLVGSSAGLYTELMTGFQESSDFTYEIVHLGGTNSGLARSRFDLWVAVGPEAIDASRRVDAGVPVVYAMVCNLRDVPRSNAAGVSLWFSVDSQFAALHRLFPGRPRLGVIYHPGNTEAWVQAARQKAGKYGVQIVPIAVQNSSEITPALAKFTPDTVDFIWILPDPMTADAVAVQKQIIHAKFSGIPVIGLSLHHVQTGAFMAFSVDQRDLGAQTAQQVRRLLQGRNICGIEAPRKMILYINKYMQQQLNIPVPQDAMICRVDSSPY
jgi:ABC-type uncharacterized transport system substrate-binding protein